MDNEKQNGWQMPDDLTGWKTAQDVIRESIGAEAGDDKCPMCGGKGYIGGTYHPETGMFGCVLLCPICNGD